MAIDPRIEASLKQSGQIGVSAINRSLYGLDNLSATINQASQFNTPDVQAINYQGFQDLSGNQKSYFDSSSKIIADNTNNTINSLENGLKNKILPQILSNAQDGAIMSGQITGDLGLAPLDSSRNLSFVSNAQAIGQQQILASVNEFSQNLTNAVTAGQSNQVALLGQANQAEMSNKQFQFSRDQFMTQVKGTLFDNGKDTGQETLSLRGQIFNEDRALGQETGFIFNRGQNTGRETLALQNQIFNQDRALGQETGQVFNRGISTGRDTFAKDQVDFNQNMADKQFDLSKDQFQLSRDQFTTNAIGDYTIDGKSQGKDTLAKQDLISNLDARTQNKALVQLQIDDYTQKIAKTKAMIAEFNPQSGDQKKALIDKYGDGVGLYWLPGTETDSKGNTKLTVNYADDAIATKGLFLNVDFNNENYKNIVKQAIKDGNLKEGATPQDLLSADVMNAIQKGKSSEALNKIGIQSDDGSQVLLALKTTQNNGETGYTFKSIDLSKMNLDQRAKLNDELGNINTKSPTLLQDSSNVIQKYTKDVQDVSPIGYMERLNGQNFAQNGNKSMTNALPNNKQLMAAIIGSGKGNSINNLAAKGILQINKDGFNFEPLQNLYSTKARIDMNTYANQDYSNFANKSNSETLRNDIIGKYYNAETGAKDPLKRLLPSVTTETYNFLKSLKETNQIISSQYSDKNSIYAGDLFKSFTMGSLNISEAQANGLYQVVNRLK